MAGQAAGVSGGHQEAWGQASDAVPLAHAPVPFPEVHPNPLPPIYPPENFNNFNAIQNLEDNKFLPGVKDHLVPPNANLANVVFTIHEEKIPPPEPHLNDLNFARTADLPVPDQQHQNTQNIPVSPPKSYGYFGDEQTFNSPQQNPFNNHQQTLGNQQQQLSPPQQTTINNQINFQSGKSVDVVPSVPVASYIASVEYPMHFVQSPIIDISVKNNAPANQHQSYFPPPTAESAQFSKEPHAGLLPLQGEATAPEAKAAPSDSVVSASVTGNQDHIPPCMREGYNNNKRDNIPHQYHHDTATANSQKSHAYAQELTGTSFESQKLYRTVPNVNLTLPTNHQPNHNSYRLPEDRFREESIPPPLSFDLTERPFEPTPGPNTETSLWTSPSSPAPSTITWVPESATEDSSIAALITADSQVTTKPSGSKKSKQIQIIVPYSVNKETGKVQFHRDYTQEVEDGRWLASFADSEPATQARKVPPLTTGKDEPFDTPKLKDFHQAQESSIVTAELSPTPWTTVQNPDKDAFAGLQHILTTDIRTLLKSEEDSLDRLRLQKNIDNWTAQEFSSVKAVRDTQDKEGNFGKTRATSTTVSSGTSHRNKLVPSKHIPKEYLTTTPISVSSTHRIDSTPDAPRNRSDKKTTNGWTLFDNLIVPAPTRTTPSSIADRQDPEIITAAPDESTPAPWERLQVSISPITQEKVYVVTPQNKVNEEETTTVVPVTNTTTRAQQSSSKSVNDFIPFRQWKDGPSTSPRPRFSIRPTPGWPKARGLKSTLNPGKYLKKNSSLYKGDALYLICFPSAENPTATSSAKSADSPSPSRPTPRGFAVQTFSGHSKVLYLQIMII